MATIYINNLNEKVSPNTLKRELQALLEPHDPVQIHLKKTLKKKGQAFVSFKTTNIDHIINKYNNHKLLGKNMRVSRAKENSYELLPQDAIDQKIRVKKYKVFNQPSKMLVLQFEGELDKNQWTAVFKQYEGFVELRVIPGRSTAFVEFDAAESAAKCMEGVEIAELETIKGKISFAKE